MSDHSPYRRPAAFRLDDPDVTVTSSDTAGAPAGATVRVTPEPDAAQLPAPVEIATTRPRRGFRWSALFWSALGGLGLLAVGLSVTGLVEDLFARSQALGWIGLSLAVLAGFALSVIVTREIVGLVRLATVETLRQRAAAAIVSDDRAEGGAIVDGLLRLMRRSPRLARARMTLTLQGGEIIDGADLVRLAERELMTPLDQEARRLVSAAAQRVSIVTAVSPRASVDMIFVLATAFALIRRLAFLYGSRPGTLGQIRLARLVVSHLAVTGGLAVGDSVVQQVLGHGVVAKLSARLGEGVLNGLLTARVGLAAIEVTRPLPFAALPQPALRDLAADLLRRREGADP
jgi:putative membrane protein